MNKDQRGIVTHNGDGFLIQDGELVLTLYHEMHWGSMVQGYNSGISAAGKYDMMLPDIGVLPVFALHLDALPAEWNEAVERFEELLTEHDTLHEMVANTQPDPRSLNERIEDAATEHGTEWLLRACQGAVHLLSTEWRKVWISSWLDEE